MHRNKVFKANTVVSGLCSRNFPGIFGNQQQHYMDVIKRMLVQCMQDQANPHVSTRDSSVWRVALFLRLPHQLCSNQSSDSYLGSSGGSVLCSVERGQHGTTEALR